MQPLVTLPCAGLLQEHFDADRYIEGVGTRTGHGTYYLFWTRLEPVAIVFGPLPAWRAVARVRQYRAHSSPARRPLSELRLQSCRKRQRHLSRVWQSEVALFGP